VRVCYRIYTLTESPVAGVALWAICTYVCVPSITSCSYARNNTESKLVDSMQGKTNKKGFAKNLTEFSFFIVSHQQTSRFRPPPDLRPSLADRSGPSMPIAQFRPPEPGWMGSKTGILLACKLSPSRRMILGKKLRLNFLFSSEVMLPTVDGSLAVEVVFPDTAALVVFPAATALPVV